MKALEWIYTALQKVALWFIGLILFEIFIGLLGLAFVLAAGILSGKPIKAPWRW